MTDRYGYIGIETLLNFCEKSKDHSITPNDIVMLKRVNVDDLISRQEIYNIVQSHIMDEFDNPEEGVNRGLIIALCEIDDIPSAFEKGE